jgi:Ca2+-binding RTX toxin-like protein
MAVVTTSTRVNMDANGVWYGVVESSTSSEIVIRAGSLTGIYRGSFTYDVYGNVYGQLYSYQVAWNGVVEFSMTSINRDAHTYAGFVNSGDGYGALQYVLSGADRIDGSRFDDRLRGFSGNDRIDGRDGADRLDGGRGNDTVFGSAGADRLFGDVGNDRLDGGVGGDTLTGGLGKDQLYAGIDNQRDVFVFQSVTETRTGVNRDTIFQFDRSRDVIDLRQIDANTDIGGNQAFDFSGTGRDENAVWTVRTALGILVQGDVDGDRVADFEILVKGNVGLNAGDFLL